MSISKQKDESLSAIIQDLAEKMRLTSSNSKFMQPKCINLEMKNLSNSVQEIAAICLESETDIHSMKFSSELSDISLHIDHVLQFFSSNRDIHKVASELRAIRSKLEKTSKKLQSNVNSKKENRMKMTLKNAPIPTLTVSSKDKESIIDLLLQSEPCIVPIVHKYKQNCSKFARDIFEDKRVSKHFTRRIWVDAPRLIDEKKFENLVQKRPTTLFWVIKTLDKHLEEKKLLLVFDDIKKKLAPGSLSTGLEDISTVDRMFISTSNHRSWYCSKEIVRSEKTSVEEAWEVIKEERMKRSEHEVVGSEAWEVIKEGKVKNLEYERIGKKLLSEMERKESMVKDLRILLSENMELVYWKMMAESPFWRIPFDEDEVLSVLLRWCFDL